MPPAPAGEPSLAQRLAARIDSEGPLAVSDYVSAALYDSDAGFYRTGGSPGRRGDFLTSPEIGPLFGAVLARALDSWWVELGRPDRLTVVDLGAGSGVLARTVSAARPDVDAAGAMRWIAVDGSPALRVLEGFRSDVELHDRMPAVEGPVVCVANEVLDNLPFDVVERTVDGWREVRVGLDDDGRFATVAGPALASDLDPTIPPGSQVPLQREARRLIGDLHGRIGRGRIVAIDYAARTAELARRSDRGWLRTYRAHDGQGDWLADPGSRDITVDVATDQVTADHPATVLSSQADFLHRHGIQTLVEAGRRGWRDRAHLGDLEALASRSRVREAEALLDPTGLGGFTVLEWEI